MHLSRSSCADGGDILVPIPPADRGDILVPFLLLGAMQSPGYSIKNRQKKTLKVERGEQTG